jgi:hypothetical protein
MEGLPGSKRRGWRWRREPTSRWSSCGLDETDARTMWLEWRNPLHQQCRGGAGNCGRELRATIFSSWWWRRNRERRGLPKQGTVLWWSGAHSLANHLVGVHLIFSPLLLFKGTKKIDFETVSNKATKCRRDTQNFNLTI